MEQYLNFLGAVKIGSLVAVGSLTYIIIFSIIEYFLSLYAISRLRDSRSQQSTSSGYVFVSSDRKDH